MTNERFWKITDNFENGDYTLEKAVEEIVKYDHGNWHEALSDFNLLMRHNLAVNHYTMLHEAVMAYTLKKMKKN